MSGDFSVRDDEAQLPIRGGFDKQIKTCADVLIEDGEYIGSLRAVSTPGHTPQGQCRFTIRVPRFV